MLEIRVGLLRFCKGVSDASLLCFVVFLAAVPVTDHPVVAQMKCDPDHPEFQEMVAGGLEFIRNNQSVKDLSNQRLLDNVPALIHALTDPAPEIVVESRRALLYVSRKTGEPRPGIDYSSSRINAWMRFWCGCYLKVQPDGVFLTGGNSASRN